MSWSALADAANVVARDVFAEPVTYTPSGGGAVTLETPFDLAYEEVVVEEGVAVATVGPALAVRLADLPSPPRKGDMFEARGVTYKVKVVKPNGHGWARLTAAEVG